jgi:hypothetical protein
MPDNWTFVAAAYGLTALVLGLYWRHLVRKEKELVAGTTRAHTERTPPTSTADRQIAERSRHASGPGHPRNDPTTRGPLQQ